jgi:hypothetical protein
MLLNDNLLRLERPFRKPLKECHDLVEMLRGSSNLFPHRVQMQLAVLDCHVSKDWVVFLERPYISEMNVAATAKVR